LFCVFRKKSLALSCLTQRLDICTESVRCRRINEGCAGNIQISCSLFNLFFLPDQNNIRDSFRQHFCSGCQCSHVRCFRQYDCFSIRFCLVFNLINNTHLRCSFQLSAKMNLILLNYTTSSVCIQPRDLFFSMYTNQNQGENFWLHYAVKLYLFYILLYLLTRCLPFIFHFLCSFTFLCISFIIILTK